MRPITTGRAHGDGAEVPHVRLEPPRQRIVAADDAVLGDGGEEDDGAGSHRDRGLDVRMRVVAFEHKILVAQREQIFGRRIDSQRRQRARLARQLQPRLVEMVEIKVGVAQAVDEGAGLEPADLRHQRP